VLGIDPAEVTSQSIGVNHCIFATHLDHNGDDLYPRIDRWIEDHSEAYWADDTRDYNDFQMSRAAIDQYQFLGLMPIGGTVRHTGWQYHVDLATKERWFGSRGGFDSELGWASHLAGLDREITEIFRVAADSSVRVTDVFPPERTREQQVPIMDSIVNDRAAIYQVNVPNRGAIPGIADDVVVELPALVGPLSVQPLMVGPLPKRIMVHVILPKILEMERHVEAVRSGDRRLLLSSLLWDHRTRTVEQAQAYLEALLAAPHNVEMLESLS
jgi:alpha-galactosidase